MDLGTIISSSVLAGLVAALVSMRSSERKIQIENITQERAKWREKIRNIHNNIQLAAAARDFTQVAQLKHQLIVNINPIDAEDIAIISIIENRMMSIAESDVMYELSMRIALLLKHDWERAKHECKPWFFKWNQPKRTKFQ